MATEFYTIHIFGYGETQLIKKDYNKKVSTSSLKKVKAVIDNVYSKKPKDSRIGTEYFAINIFKDMFANYIPKGKDEKAFRVNYSELNSSLLDDLIAEIEASNK